MLGDLSAIADWGFAPDYVDAMWRIVQLENSDDYIIATGIPHSIAQFAEIAFGYLKLDWRNYVVEDNSLIQKPMIRLNRLGDSSKLRERTGWEPRKSFTEMIEHIVEVERQAIEGTS